MLIFSEKFIARFVACALFTSVLAGTWDAWWHGAIGRETLFEPPHLLLYFSTLLAIVGGAVGYRKTKDKLWKRLALILFLVPLSAPFDELWHRIFGIEDLTSPLIVWSPPHLAILFSIIAAFVSLFPILQRDSDISAKRLFGGMTLAGILSLFLFFLSPVQPTAPWELLGFWGAIFTCFAMVSLMLISSKLLPGLGGATTMIVFFILISAIGFGEGQNPNIKTLPHDHAPSFLTVFSLLITALFVDLSRRVHMVVRGAAAGFLCAALFYPFATYFFQPEFQYGSKEVVITLISGIVGGILAGIFVRTDKVKSIK